MSYPYEEEILAQFDIEEKTPRPHQIKIISEILQYFLDKNKKYVVLNAPTGSGKSIIGKVVADVLRHHSSDRKRVGVFAHTNLLQEQYTRTCRTDNPIQVKGATNYSCVFLETFSKKYGKGLTKTCENCVQKHCSEYTKPLEDCHCPYRKLMMAAKKHPFVITNNTFYLTDALYVGLFFKENMLINIFDECHLFNDCYCEAAKFVLNPEHLSKEYEKEIGNDENLFNFKKEWKFVSEVNYKNALFEATVLYGKLHGHYEDLNKKEDDPIKSLSFSKKMRKCIEMSQKIDVIFKSITNIVEIIDNTLVIRQPFIGDNFESLNKSKYSLFMSATITEEYMMKAYNFKPEDVAFVNVGAVFPKENKNLVYFKPLKLNYSTMKEERTISNINQKCLEVCEEYLNEGKKGIILTPSFSVNNRISSFLQYEHNIKVFQHEQKELYHDPKPLAELLNEFKKCSDPCVLISPSIYEGVDLPGDDSEFQIIVKAPYASLGDKRMKYILENEPYIYNFITISKIVQGMGRSVRSENDKCDIYVLDTNIKNLLHSPLNIWDDEYTTYTIDEN